MSDPFRDDNDAAVARAEALQAELDRTKKERDELAEKLEQAEDKAEKLDAIEAKEREEREARAAKAKQDREDDDRIRQKAKKANKTVDQLRLRRRMILTWVIGGVASVALVLGLSLPGHFAAKRHRVWVADKEKRELTVKRWGAMLTFRTCLQRADEFVTQVLRYTPDIADPRKGNGNYYQLSSNQADSCAREVGLLAVDPDLAMPVRDAFASFQGAVAALDGPFRTIADYYAHSDWREDNYASAPQKWKAVHEALETVASAIDTLRAVANPGIRRYIEGVAATQPFGSPQRWRITLGMRVLDVVDAVDQVKAGKLAMPALVTLAKTVIDESKDAPLDVRRQLRATSLDQIVDNNVAVSPSTYGLFDTLDDDDNAPFPSYGEEPSAGCDGDGGDGF